MTLFLDTSALVKRYRREEGTDRVLAVMDEDPRWIVSAVARTEATLALDAIASLRTDTPILTGRATISRPQGTRGSPVAGSRR